MKIIAISANLDSFDSPIREDEQELPEGTTCDFIYFDDANFPPRKKAMSSRLQARIPKMFGWQFFPGYDRYIWFDSSLAVTNPKTVAWLVEQLGDSDIALFRHSMRKTIREEYDFLKRAIEGKSAYFLHRYEGEWLEAQMAAIEADRNFDDNILFASTAFIYRDNERVRQAMKEWWYHTSRFHIIDQLALPYAVWRCGCKVKVIEDNVYECDWFTCTRIRLARLVGGRMGIAQTP